MHKNFETKPIATNLCMIHTFIIYLFKRNGRWITMYAKNTTKLCFHNQLAIQGAIKVVLL